MIIKNNPISRKPGHQKDKNEIQLQENKGFLMDDGVVPDNTISNNAASKLLCNVILLIVIQHGMTTQRVSSIKYQCNST
jgi:hypothetical protein